MESLNLKSVFFEALKYPEYARPNFYIRKQQESGWSKGVYLTALNEVYYTCVEQLRFAFRNNSKQIGISNLNEIPIPIKDLTGEEGKNLITKKELDNLHLAVQAAQYFNAQKLTFSIYEKLSLIEYALSYIKTEFLKQSQDIDGQTSTNTNSICLYLIAQDGPFFDFPTFKSSIRELLLSGSESKVLSKILSKYHATATDIVNIWNEKLSVIENRLSFQYYTPETIRVEFYGKQLKHIIWSDIDLFELKQHNLYTNRDLAIYAANIAALLASEVLINQPKELTIYKGGSYTNNTLELLKPYSEVTELYKKAIERINTNVDPRNAMDDLRLSLELLLKKVLKNDKSLENQCNDLGRFQNERGMSKEMRNMFIQLLNYYTKYQNNHVKHNNTVNTIDLEFILHITSIFMSSVLK